MSHRNEHHGLPRSHGGSSHSSNITMVDEQRHSDWHSIVGHPTPDGLLRYMLLVHATRLRPALPPTVIADGLAILNPNDWEAMYDPKALIAVNRSLDSRRNLTRHQIHRWSHIGQEARQVEQVVVSLSMGTEPHRALADVADDLQGFFQTTSPADQMRHILLEKDRINGQVAWSKPLTPSVRSNLLDVLRGANVERHTDRQQAEVLETIFAHMDQIERARGRLQPDLQNLREYQAWRQTVLERRRTDACGEPKSA